MRKLFLTIALLLTACRPAVVQPVLPTPTAMPTVTPSPAAMPIVTFSPAATPIDPTPYHAAMKPAFAAEVDRSEAAGATEYQIDLTVAPDLTSYTAQQKVRYTNKETVPLNEVYFRLFPNTPSYGGQLAVDMLSVNSQPVTPTYELGNSAMRIDLASPLKPGESIVFEMQYASTVPTQTVAAGFDQFGLYNGVLTLPDFYPLIPAYDDEGWHVELAPGYGDAVFSDTALYQVNITAPANAVVVASGVCHPAPAARSEPSPGTQTMQCASGPMRDFMIAMSPDFQMATETVDGAQINSYYLKEDQTAGQHGLHTAVDAVKFYSQRFGAYPFNELNLVETPTTAGGIEYPGLVVVAQQLYEKNPMFQEGATAHEVSHQWWYSLVGDDQVNDPWLDEALAQFSTALYYRDEYGPPGMDGYIAADLTSRYNRVKGTPDDMRADLPVARYSPQQYSAIVYGKAPLFYKALYDAMGDEKFDKFLQTYLAKNRYGVAYAKDLLDAAATQIDQKTLDDLYQKWITTP